MRQHWEAIRRQDAACFWRFSSVDREGEQLINVVASTASWVRGRLPAG
jgi:hypothetical protein